MDRYLTRNTFDPQEAAKKAYPGFILHCTTSYQCTPKTTMLKPLKGIGLD
jgi:hypothetical protein